MESPPLKQFNLFLILPWVEMEVICKEYASLYRNETDIGNPVPVEKRWRASDMSSFIGQAIIEGWSTSSQTNEMSIKKRLRSCKIVAPLTKEPVGNHGEHILLFSEKPRLRAQPSLGVFFACCTPLETLGKAQSRQQLTALSPHPGHLRRMSRLSPPLRKA